MCLQSVGTFDRNWSGSMVHRVPQFGIKKINICTFFYRSINICFENLGSPSWGFPRHVILNSFPLLKGDGD